MRRPGPVEYDVYLIGVDPALCDGCGACARICSVDVFVQEDGCAAALRPENCLGCQGCVEVCPSGAITLTVI
jgi:ferredoxin